MGNEETVLPHQLKKMRQASDRKWIVQLKMKIVLNFHGAREDFVILFTFQQAYRVDLIVIL